MSEINNTIEQAPECPVPHPGRHLGINVKHIREILCIKQTGLALKMGVSQQTISNIESKAEIDKETLEKIAEVLEVPVILIENFNLDEIVYNIQNIEENIGNPFVGDAQTNNTTNSLDVIKFTIQQHLKLHEKVVKEKNDEIRTLKTQIRELEKEQKALNAEYIALLKQKNGQ